MDSCTSRISLFESKDLKASSVRRHLKTYFQCQPLSEFLTCNLGTEFRQDLAAYLAGLGIQLHSMKPYNKGSTAVAESSIRLVKAALRKYCLTSVQDWDNWLPLVCHAINGHLLYNTVSRDCLHYAPYHFRSCLRLYNLEFPELLLMNSLTKSNTLLNYVRFF